MVSDPRSLTVLGIESSCDETAAAVVRDGREVLSSVIVSQVEAHAVYGGVVPEIAGRSHLEAIGPTVERALAEAGLTEDELSGLAVTTRPGLVGSLLVGASYAKGLAYSRGLPLVGVHHIEAHVYAAAMDLDEPPWPCLALVVSGGHTALYRADSPLSLTLLAATLDDAAGEAFDKVAWMLGTSYPGGPSISRLAAAGDPSAIRFPRHRPKQGGVGFSFSGLKTAVLYHLRGGDALAPTPAPEDIPARADVAASFEQAVVDSLVDNTLRAAEAEGLERILVAGGVAANARLRLELCQRAAESNQRAFFPPPEHCTDNAVMIAGLGHHLLAADRLAGLELDVRPN
ncbi:MAG TPA: tRNA (adenosine(37)-N6)-threonylcarbamoyltransferase complex transferase subunit TsaD [Planctomycetota bacterium]|jgi:N6-L-threonylcarbamoyladenine synthase|nr:tRNA (adenosine(37)-N6)-threonylcarbamoyltransferase complex transferase subunit TsaD [Planctomycetota bacterium]